MSKTGLVKSSNPNVHFIYLEDGDFRLLIALNVENSIQTATFAVEVWNQSEQFTPYSNNEEHSHWGGKVYRYL